MKYIKKYERKTAYKYLSEENAEKIEKVIIDFIENEKILDKINNLVWGDYKINHFNYLDIFDSLLTPSNLYSHGNIYYVIDTYLRDNELHVSAPESRNTAFEIINKLYKEYKVKKLLDDRLIEILNRKPEKYKKIYDIYKGDFSKEVKKECKWMLDMNKYNL
jgi:hypothetical protein